MKINIKTEIVAASSVNVQYRNSNLTANSPEIANGRKEKKSKFAVSTVQHLSSFLFHPEIFFIHEVG